MMREQPAIAARGGRSRIDSSFGPGHFTGPTLYVNVRNNTLDNTNHVPGDPSNEGNRHGPSAPAGGFFL